MHTLHTKTCIVNLHIIYLQIFTAILAKFLDVTPCKKTESVCVYREVQVCLTLHIGAIATRNTGNDASA